MPLSHLSGPLVYIPLVATRMQITSSFSVVYVTEQIFKTAFEKFKWKNLNYVKEIMTKIFLISIQHFQTV
jgi:hypothetical protein